MIAIGIQGLPKLTVGQPLLLDTCGLPQTQLKAQVTVVNNPGSNGVFVKIEKIELKGIWRPEKEGNTITVSPLHLYPA